jgi:hypothetical protein
MKIFDVGTETAGASAKSEAQEAPPLPTATSLPFESIATDQAKSCPPKTVVTLPSAPNELSKESPKADFAVASRS